MKDGDRWRLTEHHISQDFKRGLSLSFTSEREGWKPPEHHLAQLICNAKFTGVLDDRMIISIQEPIAPNSRLLGYYCGREIRASQRKV